MENFAGLSLGSLSGEGGSSDSKLAALEAALKGDGYSYIGATEAPSELNVGTDPDQIKSNINAIVDYTQLLINGDGPANRIQKEYGADIPIGDRYFLNTGGQCRPVKASKGCQNRMDCERLDIGTSVNTATGKIKVVPRSMLINNIPENDVPIPQTLKDASGSRSLKFDGIVPGIINDVLNMNPMGIIAGFMIPPFPDCIETSITTVTGKGQDAYKPVTQKAYVITSEAQNIHACAFSDFRNPLTGETCPASERWHEGFSGMQEDKKKKRRETMAPIKRPDPTKVPERIIMPKDPAVKLYMILVSLLGSYILYRMLFRKFN
jgi:hypothetical protein